MTSRLTPFLGLLLLLAAAAPARAQPVRSDFATGLTSPASLVQLADGRVLVSESGRVSLLDRATGARTPFTTDLSGPNGLVQLPGGRILVAETDANRVSALDATTGARTDFATGLNGPVGLLRLPDGRILVTEFYADRISALDATTGARSDYVAATARGPQGIVRLLDGRILFAESIANRVSMIGATGAPAPTVFATGLNFPAGLIQLADGRILVAEFGSGANQISELNGNTAAVTPFATGLNRPRGFGQLADGRLLVTEFGAGRVSLLTEPVPALTYRTPGNTSYTVASPGKLTINVRGADGGDGAGAGAFGGRAGGTSGSYQAQQGDVLTIVVGVAGGRTVQGGGGGGGGSAVILTRAGVQSLLIVAGGGGGGGAGASDAGVGGFVSSGSGGGGIGGSGRGGGAGGFNGAGGDGDVVGSGGAAGTLAGTGAGGTGAGGTGIGGSGNGGEGFGGGGGSSSTNGGGGGGYTGGDGYNSTGASNTGPGSASGGRAFVGRTFVTGASIGSGGTGLSSGRSGQVVLSGAATLPPVTQAIVFNPTNAQGDGAGYRLLGAPVFGVTVRDLADLNLVQGVAAGTNATTFPAQYPAGAPNLFTGFGSTGYTPAATTAEVLAPGRGFFWYLYDRDIPAGTGFGGGTSVGRELTGFQLSASSGTQALSDVTAVFADNPSGDFQMLANPFARPLAVSGITATGGTIQGGNVFYAYNPNGNAYVTLTGAARLAVWQGVFAELVPTAGPPGPPGPGAGTVTVTYALASTDTNAPPTFYGRDAAEAGVRLTLDGTLASGAHVADDAALVRFMGGATDGWDAFDASKPVPPGADVATVSPVITRDGAPYRLGVDSRAPGVAAAVPLAFATSGAGTFTLTWAATLPDGWAATLADTQTGQTVDLGTATEYAFTTTSATDGERFVLTLAPRGATAGESDAPTVLSLAAARPNPTPGAASLVLSLPAAADARVAVYDVLGREVAVLADGSLGAGLHTLRVAAGALPAGTYVVRASVGARVLTQRLTVVR